jgi:amidase
MNLRAHGWHILAPVILAAVLATSCERHGSEPAKHFEVIEASITDIQAALQSREVTSRALVDLYVARIKERDPQLNAIIRINPNLQADADRLDRERAAGKVRGPLHGIPVIIKDNIDVIGMPNTAGSLALADNVPAKDAHLVDQLIKGGAIILAKANLSEWANIRSSRSSSGWSAVGGLAHNPYALDRTACGSSSGSGVAVAVSFAPVAVGTETNGSVTCPASINGLVGLKPTVGLVSRSGIVPISQSQDTAGPMARSVKDAAILLSVMTGPDAADSATSGPVGRVTDYATALDPNSLKGARLGVLRFLTGSSPPTDKVFEAALVSLKAQGAELVDIKDFDFTELRTFTLPLLLTELRVGLNAYLAGTPETVKTRTLADVIAFNIAEPRETEWFGQELFEQAESTRGLDDPAYVHARDTAQRIARDGINRMLRDNNVVALIAPTTGPAWTIDLINGDHSGGSATTLPAVAGYPHLTVPMGNVLALPVGLSFIGPAWSEGTLLSLGYAFEQATHARRPPGGSFVNAPAK